MNDYHKACNTRLQISIVLPNDGNVKYAGAVYEVRTYGSVRGMRQQCLTLLDIAALYFLVIRIMLVFRVWIKKDA